MTVKQRAVAIMGATATGKSDLSIRLAEEFDGEIISMDSRQVYRGFDIGTGKVPTAERRRVPHHLIDILEPHQPNSAGAHVARAEDAIADVAGRGRIAFLVGGTGLYFRVLFRGIIDAGVADDELGTLRDELSTRSTEELYEELAATDPDRANVLSRRDRVRIIRAVEISRLTGKTYSQHVAGQAKRVPWEGIKIVLTLPRPALRRRIAQRTRDMYRDGWVSEVRSLVARGVGLDAPAMGSLGYAEIARAVADGADAESTVDSVIVLTQQYAKKQETFFRSEPDARWIDASAPGASDTARRLIRDNFGL